jgi:hypothetical protein
MSETETTTTTPVAKQTAATEVEVDYSDQKIYTENHVKKIHQENAERRLKIRELEARLLEIDEAKAQEAAKKLEQDGEFKKLAEEAEKKAKKIEAEAQQKIQAQQRKAIKTHAKALLISEGIIDTDDVALLDLSKVEWDENADEPSGLEDLIKAFKKAKPAKFKSNEEEAPAPKARAKTTTPSSATGTGQTKGKSAWDMTPAEFKQAWGRHERI